jgi:hypothetical protein
MQLTLGILPLITKNHQLLIEVNKKNEALVKPYRISLP